MSFCGGGGGGAGRGGRGDRMSPSESLTGVIHPTRTVTLAHLVSPTLGNVSLVSEKYFHSYDKSLPLIPFLKDQMPLFRSNKIGISDKCCSSLEVLHHPSLPLLLITWRLFLVYQGLTPQQQPGSYRGGDYDGEMSV